MAAVDCRLVERRAHRAARVAATLVAMVGRLVVAAAVPAVAVVVVAAAAAAADCDLMP